MLRTPCRLRRKSSQSRRSILKPGGGAREMASLRPAGCGDFSGRKILAPCMMRQMRAAPDGKYVILRIPRKLVPVIQRALTRERASILARVRRMEAQQPESLRRVQ